MNTTEIRKINVAGMILWKQGDGTYVASVARKESNVVEYGDPKLGETPRVVQRAWDIRVDQEWLQKYPSSWVPA